MNKTQETSSLQNSSTEQPISPENHSGETAEKKVVYAQTIDIHDPGTENQQLQQLTAALGKLEKERTMMARTLTRLEEESSMLREMFNNANNELVNLKKPALLVAEVVTVMNRHQNAIVRLPNGNKFYCYISKQSLPLEPNDSVLVEQKSLNIITKVEYQSNFDVEKFVIMKKPQESWKEIGGLSKVIQEVKEVIELPLTKPHLFEKVGIHPPKGMLLYGPPGTGKTLLAKAVAHSTNATFIEIVGSELVQKFIGEGAKLVKEIFMLARSRAPAIIFIDEIDALAATRLDTGTSGEREVNRTFMQLLAEMDGFKHLDNVKVIGATNRLDILDPAIIRPGRLDRLIEIGLPDEAACKEILKVHMKRMNATRVRLAEITRATEGFSGAELKAVCTEAGYFAIRENREYVTHQDFLGAVEKVRLAEEDDKQEKLFG